jgi:hypothetical protein
VVTEIATVPAVDAKNTPTFLRLKDSESVPRLAPTMTLSVGGVIVNLLVLADANATTGNVLNSIDEVVRVAAVNAWASSI